MPANVTRRFQLGQETVWGTPVVATARINGMTNALLRVQNVTEFVEEVGFFGPSGQAAAASRHAEMTLEGYTSYEDILYPLVGMFGIVTPTGAGTFVWTFAGPVVDELVPQPYTVEFGMPGYAYKVEGALMSALTLTGEAGGLEQFTAEMIGQDASVLAALATPADRAFEAVRAANTELYIDPWAGAMGTTAVPATGISWELALDSARHLKQFFNSIVPTGYGQDRWSGTLRLVLEVNAASKAIIDALLLDTVQRQIELRSTSGTKTIKRQFAGTLEGAPLELYSDRDGNATVELTFRGTYNPTFGNWIKIIVTNGVATLV